MNVLMRLKTIIPADLLPHFLYCVTALISACMFRYSFVGVGESRGGYLVDRWTGKMIEVGGDSALPVKMFRF